MIVAAAIALLVVHGFGRFVFTPMIPLFIDDGFLSLSDAANLASWNYLGYLIGAMLALAAYRWQQTRSTLVWSLAINVVLTALQLLADSVDWLVPLRLFNGISNGLVFVLAPAIVLEVLVKHERIKLSGFIYVGVGSGIVASDLIVDYSAHLLSGADRWLPVTLVAILPMVWACWQFIRLDPHYLQTSTVTSEEQSSGRLWTRATTPLFLAYAGAGLGYILPMTFLPALAADWSLTLAPSAWLIAAIASIPSVWLWNALGTRFSDRRALVVNYWIQASGIAAILMFPGTPLALWLCATLVGGTFIGTVSLTQRLARQLQPHQGPKLSAALISLYGALQLAGPMITDYALQWGLTLSQTFTFSCMALTISALMMLAVPNKSH